MREVNQRYYHNTNDPCVIWVRGIYGATLAFRVSYDADVLILKQFRPKENTMKRSFGQESRYFALTDEEVERMVVPRII